MSVFTDNLKKKLREENTTYAAMSKEIGISKNGLKYWTDNDVLPRSDVLLKIANYLHTDIDVLLAGTPKQAELSDDEIELLAAFRSLDRSKQRQLLGKAYELQDAQESKSDAAIAPPHVDLAALSIRDRQIKK